MLATISVVIGLGNVGKSETRSSKASFAAVGVGTGTGAVISPFLVGIVVSAGIESINDSKLRTAAQVGVYAATAPVSLKPKLHQKRSQVVKNAISTQRH